ncbi:MAG TPA: glycosyltransferase family 2 protein, partial [Agriterribacter sp.]|nr:glycosyltransferase family 2 protein [Agriterribacter sp.]
MSDTVTVNNLFNRYRTCVIIPTYNNADTLPAVIADVAAYTHQIIVVNDGSTDDTALLLASFPYIHVTGYANNKGKGMALRKGFERAVELGYTHAITIDSDGQHFAGDLPVFIDKLKEAPGAIIIGARNMDQAAVPGKSSFGNKFSNFWFKIETGINAPDTQSGYRLYPVAVMSGMRFFTRKYEFEIEVLVRAAWKGIAITAVPVSVYYAPKAERVSHFRPFRDFLRISLLNALLV